MRKLIAIVSLLLVAGVVLAETDKKALRVIRDIQQGKNNKNQIRTLRVQNNATVGGTFTLTGAATLPLSSNSVWIGNAAGIAAAMTLSGDATISTNGTVAIAAGVIVNADVNTNAAIALTKLANGSFGTAQIATAFSNDTGAITASDITTIAGGTVAIAGNVTVDGSAGFSGIVTNRGTITNILYFHEGIVTNVTVDN